MSKLKIDIAYGSNLNLPQMAKRCPSARVLGTSEIKDYKLLLRGSRTGSYATIEPCEASPFMEITIDDISGIRYNGSGDENDNK